MNLPPPIDLREAQDRLLGMARSLGSEDIAITKATGRYLAQDLNARRSNPSADLSAMDGYAVQADGPDGPWTVVGESAAGKPFDGSIRCGEAARISTGAHMPKGSGAVLLQEHASRTGAMLSLNGSGVPRADYIRRRGFDFQDGDTLVDRGTLIGPAELALGLAGGNSTVTVSKRPKLRIIESGQELASDPGQVGPHQIPATNGAMLAAMAAQLVGACDVGDPIGDKLDSLVAAFEQTDAEVIVTCGGASVGDHDLVRPALEKWGAELAFWRIAMKPGKPLLVARKGDRIVLGLPGNPVSSFVTGYLFLLPLLRRIAGARQDLPSKISAQLRSPLPGSGERREFFRARLDADGLNLVSERDSSALLALSQANALIERPANSPEAPAGTRVSAYLLQNGGIA